MKKDYLGDGVYIEFDGYQFWLRTNELIPGHFENNIALEPAVMKKLLGFEEAARMDAEVARKDRTR